MGQALVAELAVERDDRVADHVRQHHVASRFLDLVDHRGPFGVAQFEIFVGDPFRAGLFDQDLANLGHLARVNVVGPDDEELLLVQVLDDPRNVVRQLLVRNGARVDDVLRAFEAFVVGRVDVKILALLEHRQHRLARRGRVGPEHGRHAVLDHELRSFFVIGLGVRGAVLDDRLDHLAAEHAAGGVDFVDRHQGRVGKRLLDNRQATGKRKQNADLDLVGGFRRFGEKIRSRHGTRRHTRGSGYELPSCDRHFRTSSHTPIVTPSHIRSVNLGKKALLNFKALQSPYHVPSQPGIARWTLFPVSGQRQRRAMKISDCPCFHRPMNNNRPPPPNACPALMALPPDMPGAPTASRETVSAGHKKSNEPFPRCCARQRLHCRPAPRFLAGNCWGGAYNKTNRHDNREFGAHSKFSRPSALMIALAISSVVTRRAMAWSRMVL